MQGLGDPTGALPAGHVFLSGTVGNDYDPRGVPMPASGHVFVTRSPCVLKSAGQVLPVVTMRPSGMALEAWEWLVALPFGGILFSTAGGDTRAPIPVNTPC